ncbi:MAG: hypothetical protein NZM37_05520 [Sandaracinaceae bacterium]|nr:hypothetical protein [Sandaracinaceae bacterium]MDW8245171.1 hypothetical protein [Sandaracinaceae bacterium]
MESAVGDNHGVFRRVIEDALIAVFAVMASGAASFDLVVGRLWTHGFYLRGAHVMEGARALVSHVSFFRNLGAIAALGGGAWLYLSIGRRSHLPNPWLNALWRAFLSALGGVLLASFGMSLFFPPSHLPRPVVAIGFVLTQLLCVVLAVMHAKDWFRRALGLGLIALASLLSLLYRTQQLLEWTAWKEVSLRHIPHLGWAGEAAWLFVLLWIAEPFALFSSLVRREWKRIGGFAILFFVVVSLLSAVRSEEELERLAYTGFRLELISSFAPHAFWVFLAAVFAWGCTWLPSLPIPWSKTSAFFLWLGAGFAPLMPSSILYQAFAVLILVWKAMREREEGSN